MIDLCAPSTPHAIFVRFLHVAREGAKNGEQVKTGEQENEAFDKLISPRTFTTNRLELAALKDVRRDLESKIARMQARTKHIARDHN